MHLWLGLAIGMYLTVVCVSGSLLVFRSDLQRAAFPELLHSDHQGPPADIVAVMDSVAAAYAGQRIAGVEAPTRYRQTYLAYVADSGRFRTVLADPGNGRVLGELPADSWVARLQSLHFNLMLGGTGKLLNQIAAAGLLGLVLSGAFIWWQGGRRGWRGLRLRGGPWPGLLRNFHSAAGGWAWLALLMISVTACSLMFPRQYRSLLAGISSSPPAASEFRPAFDGEGLAAAEIIQHARKQYPAEYASRVVLPVDADAPIQISFSRIQPTPLSPSAQVTRHFDRHTGYPVQAGTPSASTAIAWTTSLHVGNFAGNATRAVWAVIGLVPPLLFATGFMLWWRRVVRPRWERGRN